MARTANCASAITWLFCASATTALLLMTTAAALAQSSEYKMERIDPPTINTHPAYSQVTVVTGPHKLIFVAGQIDRPIDYKPGSNRCRHDDWAGQYRGMNENVELALKAAGATWTDVVFIRRFVVDMKKYLAAIRDPQNPIPDYWKGEKRPPSTLIEVKALSEPCQLMETDVMAVVPDKR
jgi:enamine deaminase RidA (YjgF/YER057c/UK114 family)